MAGAQVNDIKSRIKSVNGTMQITRAMELVATSKLRGAKERADKTAEFAKVMAQTVEKIRTAGDAKHTPFSELHDGRRLIIVIAGDRGLAGGFNSNIFKICKEIDGDKSSLYLPIGKKAVEFFKRRGAELYDSTFTSSASVGVGACISISELICEDYLAGKISEVALVYTSFISMISQTPKAVRLLPLDSGENSVPTAFEPIFEEEPEQMLRRIVPHYISGTVYSAATESYASELAARRAAMNSANKNAEEMIDSLMLSFNRARQAVITQEITEIVSGAEAL